MSDQAYYKQASHSLNPLAVDELVSKWIQEDAGSGFDIAGAVVGDRMETAVLLAKSSCIMAGIPFITAVFRKLDCSVDFSVNEGQWLEPVTCCAKFVGPAKNLLIAERIALNCVTRCSGVATLGRRMATLARQKGWHGQIAATRKTTPGFRLVEKYGVLISGLATHRLNLSDLIMLKDNHIWSVGSIEKAVLAARKLDGFVHKIEVECRTLDEGREAAKVGADIVMLDNFEPSAAIDCASILKQEFGSKCPLIEASGGITEHNVQDYFCPFIDIISTSRLTQGYPTVDFSIKIRKIGTGS